MDLIVAVVIGLIAGTHVSTWGMYKDAIHEGFTWPKYFRSIVIGALVGLVLEAIFHVDLSRAAGWVVFFGLVYATERLLLELWKSFLRVEDQSKYFIPMRFGIRGKPVMNDRIRWGVGAAVVVVIALFVWATIALQAAYPELPSWLVLVTIGSLGGWLTAFGGAWKDAPVEGFETFKFFRSPAISLFWAIIVAFFTPSWLFIAVAGAGYSVATIETYKTFFFPNKPRGKFAGKPILHPHMLRVRYYFVPIYVAIWIAVLGTYAAAFSQPHRGLLG
ncbi:MAG TPA: hypothetical protein VFL93_00285 [Longimicrobiaceae bacterium]|nr:hypothetical protein [Longimicrobiaceae bacterium]